MIYLASPYSHEDPAVVEYRFKVVCRVAARLMAEGHLILSPIAHTHPIAMVGKLPGDWEFWQRFDREHIDNCAEVWVLCMPGFTESKGIKGELEYAREQRKPIEYIYPLPEELAL